MDNHKQIKVIQILLIGLSSVGKYSLIKRYVCDSFSNDSTTVGIFLKSKMITIDNKTFFLHIYYPREKEVFDSFTNQFIRSMNGIILSFDLSNHDSFIVGMDLYNKIKNDYLNKEFILTGMKCDLEHQVNRDEILEFINKEKLGYIETSAKDNINVDDPFIILAKQVITNEQFLDESRTISLSNNASPVMQNSTKHWC